MSEWISVKDQPPPNFKRVLVIKQYLDAPYGEDGYETEKAYWTPPIVMIDCFFYVWAEGGKGTHWMKLPQLPEEKNEEV